MPLTELEKIQIPSIQQPGSGGTHLGEALQFICNTFDNEIQLTTPEAKGDWMPLLFVMCDGRASDPQLFNKILPELKRKNFGSIIACSVGSKTDVENLKKISDNVVNLETTDSGTFKQFFKWVSASVSAGNRSIGATDHILLPQPPTELHSVI